MKIVFFKKGELKLLWPFYLDALLSSMFFFMPAFLVIYFMNLGFNFFQIAILEMMIPLAVFLFEIPTGVIADVYGRKFSVLLGTIIEGIAIFSIFFLHNYYLLLIAFAFIGFGQTFNSGARDAWVVDLVKKTNKNLPHKYFSKKQSMNGIGLFISGIIGALLVKKFGLSAIWIVAGISCFITFFLLLLVKENFVKRKTKKDSIKNLINHTKISLKYLKKNTLLLSFFIVGALLAISTYFSGDLVWIPLLNELKFPEYAFGYLWSAMGIIGIAAPLISLKFMKKNKEKKFILIASGLIVPFLLLVLFAKNISFIILLMLCSLFFEQMTYPVQDIYFHKLVKNKIRATIGSLFGMLIGIIGIISSPLVGLSLDKFGSRYTLVIAGIVIIPAIIILLRMRGKK